MATPEMRAQRIAQLIERRGDTVTLANGDTFKAVVDTKPDEVRNVMGQTVVTLNAGETLAVFYITAAGHAKIKQRAGTPIVRKKVKWSIVLHPDDVSFSDVTHYKSMICSTGGNPG